MQLTSKNQWIRMAYPDPATTPTQDCLWAIVGRVVWAAAICFLAPCLGTAMLIEAVTEAIRDPTLLLTIAMMLGGFFLLMLILAGLSVAIYHLATPAKWGRIRRFLCPTVHIVPADH